MGDGHVIDTDMNIPKLTGTRKKSEWKLSIRQFKGVATLLDDIVLGKTYAKEARNLYQAQDGKWKVRWGTATYGLEIPGETSIIGAGVHVSTLGVRKLLAVAGSGKGYYSSDARTWTEVTGATFDTTAKRYFFEMSSGYLLIANGKDPLTRFNGTTFDRFVKLTVPAGLSGTRNVLTAGSYNLYYKVTALNSVGETAASAEFTITVNKERNTWDSAANERVDLSWTAVTNAVKYQIYFSTESGKQKLIDIVYTNSYQDTAAAVVNPFISAPDFDTTEGPAFAVLRRSETRLIGIDPEHHPYTVFFSGAGSELFSFADADGGGWVKLDEGCGETVRSVGHFRTGKGDPAPTVLTGNGTGRGSIWQVQFLTDTSTGETIIIPVPTRISGNVGTDSPGAVVETKDSLWFPSAEGYMRLNNKENVTNILSTNTMSDTIRPTFQSLRALDMMAAFVFDGKIIISASEGGEENDIIFGLDTQLNEWFYKWTVGFRQFLEFTDSNGTTRLLGIPTSGAHLTEISENILGDDGQAFSTSWISGLIPIDEDDARVAAKIHDAIAEFGRPKGNIFFEVYGLSPKKGLSLIGSKPVSNTLVANEFWTGLLGEITLKDEESAPETFSQAAIECALKVRKEMYAIQFRVSSDSIDAEYTILKIQAFGDPRRKKIPAVWYG